jgi:hypothetical protein
VKVLAQSASFIPAYGYARGRMSDPERFNQAPLPTCSAEDCKKAAGVVIDGILLCYEHATHVLEEKRQGG